jgi:hypothetical protein
MSLMKDNSSFGDRLRELAAEPIASATTEVTNEPAVSGETIAALVERPATEAATEAPAAGQGRPPAALGRRRDVLVAAEHHQQHCQSHPDHMLDAETDSLIEKIYVTEDRRERFNLIENLPLACRGVIARHFLVLDQIAVMGALGGNGVKVRGARQQWLRNFLERNIGCIMQAYCGYITPDGSIEFLDDVAPDDFIPPTFTTPDPPSSSRAIIYAHITQRDLVELADGSNGFAMYWGRRRIEARDQLLRELSGELDQPGVAAGSHGLDYVWLRRTNGDLIVIRRVQD